MKKTIYTLFIGILAIGLSACKSGESVSKNPASLQGDWKVMAINGEEVSGQAQDNHTVSFNTDGTVAGVASCNRFAGEYSAQKKGQLSMNSVSATKLECESESTNYFDVLTSASSFRVIGGDELELTSSTSSNTLVFTKVMTPGEGEES